MDARIHLRDDKALHAEAYTVESGKPPFDCFKLRVSTSGGSNEEFVLLAFTAQHAEQIVSAIGAQYPGVIAAVAREMNLGPTLDAHEATESNGCGTCKHAALWGLPFRRCWYCTRYSGNTILPDAKDAYEPQEADHETP